jgi:phosphoribosylanthranilate isomerase
MTLRVKICGVTSVADALASVDAGADLIGLNFYARSPRCITVERARAIREALGARAAVVGVFVNAPRGDVAALVEAVPLDLIQFHGDEDESALAGWPVPVIRAFRLRPGAHNEAVARTRADFVLLDAYDPYAYGGTGRALALDELRRYDLSRAFVSGGLNAANVSAVAALRPYAVDVASGVESAPGIKDCDKLRSFVRNAKSA